MNLAQVIDPRTGHVDAERVRIVQTTELACGRTIEELLSINRVSVRANKRAGPPGQGKHPGEEL